MEGNHLGQAPFQSPSTAKTFSDLSICPKVKKQPQLNDNDNDNDNVHGGQAGQGSKVPPKNISTYARRHSVKCMLRT